MKEETAGTKQNSLFAYSKQIVIFVGLATLLIVFTIQPAMGNHFQQKFKTPNYIRALSEPNNTCVNDGTNTRCATASTNGNAEVKIVEKTLGTWWAKAYHEMDGLDGVSGPPSSGFYLSPDAPGAYIRLTTYLEGKVQIIKSGKIVEARYGGYKCTYDPQNPFQLNWLCGQWFYAKKSTDGTFTFPAFTGITTLTGGTVGVQYSMGSLFECMTTGTGGGVNFSRCDAYDGDKYWKANQLYMDYPNL